MKVYLVRHTSVEWDGSIICYGQTDIDVRETFEVEAEETKKRLKGVVVDKVYTSPLKRAAKLASYCGYPRAERDARLKEMNFGSWEGRPWSEIMGGEEYETFFARYLRERTPEGESQEEQYERVRDFIEEKKREGLESILVFCHGGVINCACTLAGRVRLSEAFALIPDFGSVTMLEF